MGRGRPAPPSASADGAGARGHGPGTTDVTFRGNLRETRHGWLRLTPAYSVGLVQALVGRRGRPDLPVLDPFSGSGTTLLACAEAGVAAEGIDLNPFLVWLAEAKVRNTSAAERRLAQRRLEQMAEAALGAGEPPWLPPLHRIERWWEPGELAALGRAAAALRASESERPTAAGAAALAGSPAGPLAPDPARDLAAVALCQALIEVAAVSFGHQSMSFARAPGAAAARSDAAGGERVAAALREAFARIEAAAARPVGKAPRRVRLGDARDVGAVVGAEARFGAVITSPPYCNRMSYVRELRPYLYWLGWITEARQAADLDWRAIGGTWGVATSRTARWEPPAGVRLAQPSFVAEIARIRAENDLLGRYVHRYLIDLGEHVRSVAPLLAPGASVAYVVGNSRFSGVDVPVQELLAAELDRVGLTDLAITTLRRRTGPGGLHEYLVEGRRRVAQAGRAQQLSLAFERPALVTRRTAPPAPAAPPGRRAGRRR